MSKLHELLAVKPTREGEATSILKDHVKKFKSDHHLFSKVKKVFVASTEQAGTKSEPVTEEETLLVTTVAAEAKFALEKFGQAVDLNYTIDHANTKACADVLVGGKIIAEKVPATFLVHLEKRLVEVIGLIEAMGTADPAAGYKPDPSQGDNVLKANEIRRARTNKIEDYKTVAPATDKHPAQVVKVVQDQVIGHVTQYAWSGLPTTSQKSQMLERATNLRNAVAEARARANCHEVEQQKIFGTISDYLLAPLQPSK